MSAKGLQDAPRAAILGVQIHRLEVLDVLCVAMFSWSRFVTGKTERDRERKREKEREREQERERDEKD